MNILHVMYLYNQLKKNPNMKFYPRTFIFGAKAAAGYLRAKQTIKLINSVADKVNNDASIKGKLKVVFIEDYRYLMQNGSLRQQMSANRFPQLPKKHQEQVT